MRMTRFAAFLIAVPGLAHAGDVVMLDHTPSVDELRSYLAPEPSHHRTRGIEIVGQGAARPAMAATQAAAASPEPAPAMPQSATPAPMMAAPMMAAAPAPQPEPAAEAPATIGFRIPFALNSAELLPDGRPFLDQLGQVMQSEPQLKLAVEGHTDARGGDAYNMVLSQKRAKTVQAYLSQVWHIPASRLTVVGKGKSEPLTGDPYDAQNRRVQFRPLG